MRAAALTCMKVGVWVRAGDWDSSLRPGAPTPLSAVMPPAHLPCPLPSAPALAPPPTCRRGLRKVGCLGFTLAYTAGLTLVTCGTFFCCCVGPRMCGLAARRYLGASALITFLLFVVAVVLVLVLAPWEDVVSHHY